MTDELSKLIRPGYKIRIHHPGHSTHNRLWHVRAVVDGNQVAIRWWCRHRRKWFYMFRDLPSLRVLHGREILSCAGKSER